MNQDDYDRLADIIRRLVAEDQPTNIYSIKRATELSKALQAFPRFSYKWFVEALETNRQEEHE